jgi:hypothetical protein
MAHDGNTFYGVHDPQFSQTELVEVLGESPDTINNWVRFGHLRPDNHVFGPKHTPLRKYSIIGAARAALIASCVNNTGLGPKLAAEIVEAAAPLIDEHFERDLAGEKLSFSERYLICRLTPDGKIYSVPLYRRESEMFFFTDDPALNPDAQMVTFPVDACIVVPLTRIFTGVFLRAAELLARQGRGGMTRHRQPIDA